MSTSSTDIARILSVKKISDEWEQKDFLHSAPKTESGAIDLTKAERIAEGGTHVLYRFPDAPFVIKLMKQNPNPMELEELEKKYAVLYNCFDKGGKQRCIQEQHITCQVLLPGKEPQSAALSIVPYEKCFKSKVKFDFKIEPAELDIYLMEHNQDLFDRAHKALIHKEGDHVDFELNDYSIIDERIGAILQRLDGDPQLKEVMIEFLNHYRDFYQRTNIILDAMGFENILFFKDEGGDWQFKVGSVIKHDTGKYTQELFDTLHSGKEVDLTGFVNFTHAYFSPANIRAVNVCAMKLGLAPVIHDVTIDSKDLFRISQEVSVGERMLAYARHGDFEKVDKILQEHRSKLSFNLREFWTYSRIADEYIKHGQPPRALKNYLDTVSQLPIILPENKDDAKRVEDSKTVIIDRKNMHDKKILLHKELTIFVLNSKSSIWSPIPVKGKTCQTATFTAPYKEQLQKIIDSAHTPAVSYDYVTQEKSTVLLKKVRIIAMLDSQIAIISKKIKELENRKCDSAVQVSITLRGSLEVLKKQFETDTIDYDVLKTKSTDAINTARPELEKHRGWKEVLAKIVFWIIGIGKEGQAAVNAYKGSFFKVSTDSENKLNEIQKSIEDASPRNNE